MKLIYKFKLLALSAFSFAMMTSCDDTVPEMGGAEQNYNTAFGMVQTNTNLALFNKAIELTSLKSTLETGDSYTYFAPNDTAIDVYLVQKGYVNDLGYPDITLVPVDELKELVLSHVVKGVQKRVGKLEGVNADYMETGELTTMANQVNADLYLLSVDVTNNVLKVNGSGKTALAQDLFGSNGFVNIIENVIELAPPAPVITSLSQAFASPGDILTISGNHFVKVKSVKFDSTVAEIVGAPTKTSIQVKVPANFGSYALITVETEFGVSAPSSIGVKYLLYADDTSKISYQWGWGGDITMLSNKKVSRGTYSIEKVAGPWSGFFIGFNETLKTADYQFLKISVFPTESTKILVTINSNTDDSTGTTVVVKPGQWNHLSIPFSDLKINQVGSTFNNLFIKEYSGVVTDVTPQTSILYFDDIGFL